MDSKPKSKNSSTSNLLGSEASASLPLQDPFYGLSFSVGVAENKNTTYRSKMEDVHTYVANFAERLDWGYFAIFDGHAGKQSARWCGNNLHALLEDEIVANESPAAGTDDVNNLAPPYGAYDLKDGLHNAFVKADELIEKDGSGSSGCTAAVAVLRWETDSSSDAGVLQLNEPESLSYDFVPASNHKRVLYTSNVGDLRIVLCRQGRPYRLSYDHKASDANEIERVRELGGLILKNRVNGVLAVTRSLGDLYMKNLVTGKPFTTSTEIVADDEFLIIACDGVWDVISDAQACLCVLKVFSDQVANNAAVDPREAASKLCQMAMDNATTDNVTVMVVHLDSGVFSAGLADKSET